MDWGGGGNEEDRKKMLCSACYVEDWEFREYKAGMHRHMQKTGTQLHACFRTGNFGIWGMDFGSKIYKNVRLCVWDRDRNKRLYHFRYVGKKIILPLL